MANYYLETTLTLTDANGDTAQLKFPVGDTTDTITLAAMVADVNALITALGAPGTITNAKVTSAKITALVLKANPTGALNAQFSQVTDGARLNFLNSAGGRGVLVVPAPIPTVFAGPPNEDVVDSGGPIAALITYYTGHASHEGGLLNVYNGGVKVGRHARRRAQHKVP